MVRPETVKSVDISSDSDQEMIVADAVSSGNFAAPRSSNGMDYDDDDDDEVVREIPVFLSPELAQQIQLIQYPLQQRAHPTAPEAVRIKPRHCMMEQDHKSPSNIGFNGMYHMPSRTFTSHTIPITTHMALGKLVEYDINDSAAAPVVSSSGGTSTKQLGLHLVPLSRMTQMRPSFSHVDEAMAASTATTEEELKRQEQKTDPLTGRKSVGFQKKESERQELARKSSYGYKKASEDAEGWHSLEVYDEDSLQANLLLSKVACPFEYQSRNLLDVERLKMESKGTNIQGTTPNAKYLNTLNYLPPREDFTGSSNSNSNSTAGKSDGGKNSSKTDELSLSQIASKVVPLMRQGRPIPFSLLRAEFPPETATDKNLFVALGSCAVMVRGNWCINSKLLGYSPPMTQARTFLMCLFQSMRVVHKARLLRVFAKDENHYNDGNDDDDDNKDNDGSVTPEVIDFLLEQLGQLTSEGWVLKVTDDVKFLQLFPQPTMVHLQYWVKQIELFRPMFERYRS
mmetsp:Transcript_23321/g.47599  ORF Transcript_23321/g.47599 Transcript_23321/m.47599 type:complete len:512 (-) Transcript_23321:66-1601(-)